MHALSGAGRWGHDVRQQCLYTVMRHWPSPVRIGVCRGLERQLVRDVVHSMSCIWNGSPGNLQCWDLWVAMWNYELYAPRKRDPGLYL